MAQRKTLSERQLAVLRWIADGCPDGVMVDDHHRISAGALRNRGLVMTSGHGPSWSARITESGREYLQRADGPKPPVPREANASVTQQLVNDVITAGGSLQVPGRGWRRDDVDYEQRARLAQLHGKVPDGKWLQVSIASGEALQIDLVEAPAESVRGRRPVPVPERLSRLHPVVQEFKERIERHEISRATLPRVLRILQGLVTEAERRGYAVSSAPDGQGRSLHQKWSGPEDGHLVIEAEGYSARFRLCEEGLTSRSYWEHREWSYAPLDRRATAARLKQYEAGATGRLRLEMLGGVGRSVRPSKWADRRSWTLEDKLPDVLQEIEVRAFEVEQRRLAEQREAEERQRAWEAAMAVARERLTDSRRADALLEQVVAWETAQRIRAFCDAASAGADTDETASWLAWSRAHADSLDPLNDSVRAPTEQADVPLEDLRPFLDGWDAYAPTTFGRGLRS